MKDAPRQAFRWAPHTIGSSLAKSKDYEFAGEYEASSAYALWQSLRSSAASLQVGDLVELPDGTLRIFKYVGFEEASWAEPESPSPRLQHHADQTAGSTL